MEEDLFMRHPKVSWEIRGTKVLVRMPESEIFGYLKHVRPILPDYGRQRVETLKPVYDDIFLACEVPISASQICDRLREIYSPAVVSENIVMPKINKLLASGWLVRIGAMKRMEGRISIPGKISVRREAEKWIALHLPSGSLFECSDVGVKALTGLTGLPEAEERTMDESELRKAIWEIRILLDFGFFKGNEWRNMVETKRVAAGVEICLDPLAASTDVPDIELTDIPHLCEDTIFRMDPKDKEFPLMVYHLGSPDLRRFPEWVLEIISQIDGRSTLEEVVRNTSDRIPKHDRVIDVKEQCLNAFKYLKSLHLVFLKPPHEASIGTERKNLPTPAIFWESFITSSSSMGIVSQENILAIDSLGYPIFPYPWNDPELDQFGKPAAEPLRKRTMDLIGLAGRLPKGAEREGIGISFGGTDRIRFDRWKRCRTKILYCFLDTTAIPKASVGMLNLLDHIFCPSSFVRENLMRCGVITPITIWHHGVNPEIYRFIEREPKDGFVFLFVGVAQPRKGIWELLVAFTNEFSHGERDVRLMVKSADWGKLDGLRSKFRDDRIMWIEDTVSYAQMIDYYKQADCLVIPTRGDAFCLPALEAMATGLPVIANDWGGVRDFCNDENSYLIRNSGTVPAIDMDISPLYPYVPEWGVPDIEHLMSVLRHVYENRDEAREKGRRAAEMVASAWTWRKKAEGAMKVLEGYGLKPANPDHML